MEQLREWKQYEREIGFKQDFLFGLLCSVMVNLHIDKKHELTKPTDYMPFLERKLPNPDTVEAKIKAMFRR